MDDIIKKISETIKTTTQIDPELFNVYNVKRGLRNEDHTGVVVGLTKVGDVVGYERNEDGSLKAILVNLCTEASVSKKLYGELSTKTAWDLKKQYT